MPVKDVVQSIGDAISGVDRNKTWLEGQELGARIGEQRSRTELAMEEARQKRTEAEITEAKKAALERLRAAQTLTDPNAVPIGDIISAGAGTDYAGAMRGRGEAQQFEEHATVDQPAPIGDVTAGAKREAALESLAPAAAVQARAGGRGAPVIALDKSGDPIYVTPKAATDQGMHPAARPSSAGTQPSAHEKDVEFLVRNGWDRGEAESMVFGPKASPENLYNSVVSAQIRNFVAPEEAARIAREMVRERFGDEAALRASRPQGPQPAQPANGLPPGIPAGSTPLGVDAQGRHGFRAPDGRTFVVE